MEKTGQVGLPTQLESLPGADSWPPACILHTGRGSLPGHRPVKRTAWAGWGGVQGRQAQPTNAFDSVASPGWYGAPPAFSYLSSLALPFQDPSSADFGSASPGVDPCATFVPPAGPDAGRSQRRPSVRRRRRRGATARRLGAGVRLFRGEIVLSRSGCVLLRRGLGTRRPTRSSLLACTSPRMCSSQSCKVRVALPCSKVTSCVSDARLVQLFSVLESPNLPWPDAALLL
jgi:hypothetical protein